nr:ABC transporter substrate-binding protein [uncultured Cohaesibacter sp.]
MSTHPLTSKVMLTALTLGIGALTMAPSASAETITLDVMHPYPSFTRFEKPLADAFMKENPDIKIEFRLPPQNYMEADLTITRAAITGDLPDVYFAGYTVLESMVNALSKRDQAVSLEPFLEEEGRDWVSQNYNGALMRLGQVNETQYAIPFAASMPIIYYNADLVQKAGHDPDAFPTDWDGIIKLAQDIDALNSDIGGMDFSVGSLPGDWFWQTIVQSLGGDIVNKDKTGVGFDNKTGLDVLKLIRRIAKDTNMDVATTPKPYRQQFYAGNLGLFVGSPSILANATEAVGGRFQLRTAPFPVVASNGGLPTGGNGITITAQDAAHQKAAWKYIKFLTSPKSQGYVSKETGYLPTNLHAGDAMKAFFAENPNYATALKQMDYSRPWYIYPGGHNTEIWRAQQEIIDQVQRGSLSAEDGLKKLVEVSNSLIQ